MRTHLNERASKELVEIMGFYGHSSTNHTLNIIISSLHQSLFSKHPPREVSPNDQRSTNQDQ